MEETIIIRKIDVKLLKEQRNELLQLLETDTGIMYNVTLNGIVNLLDNMLDNSSDNIKKE